MFEDSNYKIIKQTKIGSLGMVSTVWLGLDHSFGFFGEPGSILIFESMYFPDWGETVYSPQRAGLQEELTSRYTTLKEAKQGHKKMVKEARAILRRKSISLVK